MPRDQNGRWTPEPHKADGITAKQAHSATKLATDFEHAASPKKASHAPQAHPIAAATTVHLALTPDGTTRLQPNAQQLARNRAASKTAETMKQLAARDDYQHWQAKELTKTFSAVQDRDRTKDADLER